MKQVYLTAGFLRYYKRFAISASVAFFDIAVVQKGRNSCLNAKIIIETH